jgi:DNA polymerase III subunit chi
MLAEVEFHTSVEDPVAFACRLLRKAYRNGARAWVTAPAPTLAELDRNLWTFDERDFVPHAMVAAMASAIALVTPLWLCPELPPSMPPDAPRLLVNLGAAAPGDWSALDRLIEIVALDPDGAQAGRERWRAYKATGLNVMHHKAV